KSVEAGVHLASWTTMPLDHRRLRPLLKRPPPTRHPPWNQSSSRRRKRRNCRYSKQTARASCGRAPGPEPPRRPGTPPPPHRHVRTPAPSRPPPARAGPGPGVAAQQQLAELGPRVSAARDGPARATPRRRHRAGRYDRIGTTAVVPTRVLTAWSGGTEETITEPEAIWAPAPMCTWGSMKMPVPRRQRSPSSTRPEVMQPGPVEMSLPSLLWWSKEL